MKHKIRSSRSRMGVLWAAALLALLPAPSNSVAAIEAAEEASLREAAQLRGNALAAMEEANFGRAVTHLHQLAELLPNNILPPINLAICYYHLNQPQAALEQIQQARRLGPDNPQMLYTLARLLESNPESRQAWAGIVEHFAASHPKDPRPFYLRAVRARAEGRFPEAVQYLRQSLRRDLDNLVLMVDLMAAASQARNTEAVADALDAIEDRLNGFEGLQADYAKQIRGQLDKKEVEGLRPAVMVLQNLLRPTDLYQLGLIPLIGRGGSTGPMFPQLDFEPPLPKNIQGGQDIQIEFEDRSAASALERQRPAATTTLYRGSESDALLSLGNGWAERLEFKDGRFQPHVLQLDPQPHGLALSYDMDQDQISDLIVADPRFGLHLYPGQTDGRYGASSQLADPAPEAPFKGIFPLDIDHDGDLDLFVARSSDPDLYLQNNGDGSWTERADDLGIAGTPSETSDVAVADFDDDGDLDLLTVQPSSHPRLYLNRLAGAFEDASSRFGLDRIQPGQHSVHTADFDNDGNFDLLFWGQDGGGLYLNRQSHFEAIPLPGTLDHRWQACAVGDYDNDGDQDFVVVLTPNGQTLLVRNRRSEFTVEEIGLSAESVVDLLSGDFDEDGDLDLVAQLRSGNNRFWRNRGGNRNQWLRLRLKGKNDNNSKNNTQGLFTRIEARVSDYYQVVLGNGGVNHLGLGASRQAEVIRVVWTNGLAQSWLQVSANQTLVEEQVLKGSCPFLYSWNGDSFEFVTDLMWKSPLGMILPDGSPAPHDSARDFVLVNGETVRLADGQIWLQTTEELWETAYVDRQELLAVDYPNGVKLVVDEKFAPPPYSDQPPLHLIGDYVVPKSARDHRQRNVLDRILERDGVYVDDIPLSRYQGLTSGHSLELTFHEVPPDQRLRLVLWGWIFPTDTSINFALAQDASRNPVPPSLEFLQNDGTWRVISPFIGFPNGKRKAMVVELSELIPAGGVTLRIATSMQIYWDAALLAVGDPEPPATVSRLDAPRADLHYRGYSELQRDSPSSPHLFTYDRVSVGPRFRDMAGFFTRYGDVTKLLADEDSRYVVMNAGDELTVRFDGSRLPPLPPGWRRDYILYTDGWVKDADLHTMYSQTVDPLPYHGMRSYPDRPQHSYPASPEHQLYLEHYQTRKVTDKPFRDALKRSPFPGEPLGGSG